MWIVQVNRNDPSTIKELVDVNHNMQCEHNKIRDGLIDKDQGLSEEGELRVNKNVDDASDKHIKIVQVHAHAQTVTQRPQQQPKRPSVCWERFLPFMSLKVLLVENDNSTRHVVTALLTNCGYEVTAVDNGQEAWKILEDQSNHINLVLSEVVMPCISGIGLLCKIMKHKTCKNIPVIMMSSHDSINIVFKCLSKGAVDFLVKPIRKNELKNLWQHVWRKYHSSSGSASGSESGVRDQKSAKSKYAEDSDDNNSCNDGKDIGSIGLNVRDGSDHESGTQSCWAKSAVEVESTKPMSPWDQSADAPDSTCAQAIHLMPKALDNKRVPVTMDKKCEEHDDTPENLGLGRDLEIGIPRVSSSELDGLNKEVVGNNRENLHDRILKNEVAEKQDEGDLQRNNDKPDENLEKEKTIIGTKEMPSLELSLKRHRDSETVGTAAADHNGLRHSDLSAFTRYKSSSTGNKVANATVGSCSPLDSSPGAAKESNSSSTPPNQGSNGSENNNDMGSSTNNNFSKPAVYSNKPASKLTGQNPQPHSAFQPVHHKSFAAPQPAMHGNSDKTVSNTKWSHSKGSTKQQQVEVQHHHHHYHHYHHHVHNTKQQLANPDDTSLKNMTAAAPQCSLSNMLSTPIDTNDANQDLNWNDYGSNGQNGSSNDVNPRGMDLDSDNGKNERSGISMVGIGSRIRFDESCLAQREAALNKYRQKRKERCFEKKVRYQSRKKLAEQRPRYRGQFVRQEAQEDKDEDGCS